MRIFEELIDCLEIGQGDKIWLSSEIVNLVFLCRRAGVEFDASELLDCFQKAVGEKGTLLLPTFCFSFSDTGKYDYVHSKGNTGALGNVALRRNDFCRTKHPMHSFAVWGGDQEELCAMENKHSFGADSPFAYCKEKNIKQIMLGTDYVHSMTFIHYAETMCAVPYRFEKSFTGIYVTRDGREEERIYDYAARRLDVGATEEFNRMGTILEEHGVAQVKDYCGFVSRIVRLGDSYDLICEDILCNQCRNIYDFSIPREKLFNRFEKERRSNDGNIYS